MRKKTKATHKIMVIVGIEIVAMAVMLVLHQAG
jgi:hypothetical protein